MPIVGQFGSLAGLGSLILPGGVMESIATVTVGSGGASSIEFTSIPGGFQHLQLRLIGRASSSYPTNPYLRLNGDTGTNYAWHQLKGEGSSASAYGVASQSVMAVATAVGTDNANVASAAIIDILDYGNTSKNKSVRSFTGYDRNGSGEVFLRSGLWMSTSAVTSLTLLRTEGENWGQHTTAALYGLRAP